MVKKYKLIRTYPNSPKFGSVIVDTNPGNGAKDAWFEENWGKIGKLSFLLPKSFKPEDYPEFWEEVKEKEYEILSFRTPKNEKLYVGRGTLGTWYIYSDIAGRNFDRDDDWMIKNGYTIESIKRLSDGEIFTVGDKCNLTNGNGHNNPILRFEIRNQNWGLERYRNKDRIVIFLGTYTKQEWGPIELDSLIHSKQPLFVTEDGKEIFKGDKFYFIASLSWGIGELIANDNVIGQYAIARFSTREAAEKWVDENKPVYSKADINKALLDPGGKFWQDAYLRLMEEEL